MARSRRWPLRILLVGVVGGAVVFALRGRLPDPAAVLDVVGDANPWWAVLALLAQVGSQAMFAHQQRQLLGALETDLPMPRALAITYSRSAISMALPAGSAVSAAFAMQQYGRSGATKGTAATVMILSGLASAAGLVLLYGVGTIAAASTLAGGVVLACAVGVLAWSVAGTARTPHGATPVPVANLLGARRPEPRGPTVSRALTHLADTARRARTVPARDWVATVAFAAANWLLDLACLVAVARACHLGLGYPELAGAYLAVQIVRQFPITPGGIGLIESSLLTGLTAAGAAQPEAAAVVLGYRLISFWLILPIGLATYLGLRRAGAASELASPLASPEPVA